ncbi:hypothetical protein GO613_09265 [Azoarcus communis]|uniref:hypothetical protein n=1 Tax=Parazoarcus communis TaxID=41977 RepID=UPI0014599007|nr:hypothetical protein [Parazoarcus communis]NMG48288.1 hypothetical protein [Parazoarcus communis]
MENPSQHRMDAPAALAAKAVKRMVPEIGEDGKPTGKHVARAIEADEVLANRIDGETIIVVTVAGEKLTGKAPKLPKEEEPAK